MKYLVALMLCVVGCSIQVKSEMPKPNLLAHISDRTAYLESEYMCRRIKDPARPMWGNWSKLVTFRGTGVLLGGKYVLTAEHLVRGTRKFDTLMGKIICSLHRVLVQERSQSRVRFTEVWVSSKREEEGKVKFDPYTKSVAEAVVLRLDENQDLALLKSRKTYAVTTKIGKYNLGDKVHSLGFPGELHTKGVFLRYSSGYISAVDLPLYKTDWIQFTAQIFNGNSGGGLWNSRGELIAITNESYSTYRSYYTAFYGPSAKTIRKFLNGETTTKKSKEGTTTKKKNLMRRMWRYLGSRILPN